MFPFPRHCGTGQIRRFHGLQELNQLLGLRRRHQLALVAIHVFLVNEPVDDIGAGRRRGRAALLLWVAGVPRPRSFMASASSSSSTSLPAVSIAESKVASV